MDFDDDREWRDRMVASELVDGIAVRVADLYRLATGWPDDERDELYDVLMGIVRRERRAAAAATTENLGKIFKGEL